MALFLLFVCLPALLAAGVWTVMNYEPVERVSIGLRPFTHSLNADPIVPGRVDLAGSFSCGSEESCAKSVISIEIARESEIVVALLGARPVELKQEGLGGHGNPAFTLDLSTVKNPTKYLSMQLKCTPGSSPTTQVAVISPSGRSTQSILATCP